MTRNWWEEVVFYQIYPRSFADGNGDGIGDIPGIIEKLDYLQWLGVKGIWLSPHYPSPQVDVGYDISDYTDVEPDYGTLADFGRMLAEMHNRDMKLILDLVLNHTSDQHQWFQASKSSRDNPKRDWYIWRDGMDGGPPNNWESTFGGPAWTYDEGTGQYYYHYFLKEQPDLNWRNPEVKEAMFAAVRFWLDLGVDGFRLDAIGTIYEDPDLPLHESQYTALDVLRAGWLHDEPDEGVPMQEIVRDLFGYQHDLPEVFDLMAELREVVDGYEDRFLVGETSDVRFLGDGTSHLHSIFNFDLTFQKELTATRVRQIYESFRAKFPAGTWVSNTLNNHDQSRVATHFCGGERKAEWRQLTGALVLFLEGLPLYYGEEIGMEDYAVRSFDEVRDMVGGVYRELRLADGVDEAQIVKELGKMSRDRCRTPMQWDGTANAGFSPAGVKTWLPVHACYEDGINVEAQKEDDDSLLHFYRTIIQLRNEHVALQSGRFRDLDPDNERTLIFLRESPEQTCIVALNFSDEVVSAELPASNKVLFSTNIQTGNMLMGNVELSPFEVLIADVI